MNKLPLILLMMNLVACLSGCRSSLYHKAEQCAPTFNYVDETRKLIDVDASYCSTRQYEFSLNHLGPVAGSEIKKPLPYCDRCVGFKNYADTVTFWERVRRALVIDDKEEE